MSLLLPLTRVVRFDNHSIFRSDLSVAERKDYIRSVKCLRRKPSKFSATECPGCRSRFDDFSAVHIQQTDFIHSTVSLPLVISIGKFFVSATNRVISGEFSYMASLLPLGFGTNST
jgi:hypothetical protein